jgi:hypothetical protein
MAISCADTRRVQGKSVRRRAGTASLTAATGQQRHAQRTGRDRLGSRQRPGGYVKHRRPWRQAGTSARALASAAVSPTRHRKPHDRCIRPRTTRYRRRVAGAASRRRRVVEAASSLAARGRSGVVAGGSISKRHRRRRVLEAASPAKRLVKAASSPAARCWSGVTPAARCWSGVAPAAQPFPGPFGGELPAVRRILSGYRNTPRASAARLPPNMATLQCYKSEFQSGRTAGGRPTVGLPELLAAA